MLSVDHIEIVGMDAAIRGMRNPMNSWDKSDSWNLTSGYKLGDADKALAVKLVKGGPVHAKFRRMITVYMDITAPLYWWKEFDTYKVGTVANSCSTMHKIHEKEFTEDDFSHEHIGVLLNDVGWETNFKVSLRQTISMLNIARTNYIRSKDKRWWWQMIQLLPSSYNQRRTVMLNYEVLANIYRWRKDHKLDEWRVFCNVIESLPYSELIIGGADNGEDNDT